MDKYNKVQLCEENMLPDREPTQQEIDEFHRVIAEIRVEEYKHCQIRRAKNGIFALKA